MITLLKPENENGAAQDARIFAENEVKHFKLKGHKSEDICQEMSIRLGIGSLHKYTSWHDVKLALIIEYLLRRV